VSDGFDFKILVKATRASNNTAGTPAVVCEQEVLSSRADIRERVTEAVAKAVPAKVQARVKAMVLVVRRSDGKKEALKQICALEELPAVSAALAADIATALAGDPQAPTPAALFSNAKEFAKDAHEQLKAAAEYIRPPAAAAAPSAPVAEGATAATAPKIARRAARPGAPPPADPASMFGNVLSNVLNNVLKNPENMKRAAEFGKSIAASLPPVPIKPA
jgi:hypothetical protein